MNTTSQLITNAVFNLATYPEYVSILRKDMESVVEESGGDWTLESMGKLKMLDSFIKETLRYNGHLTGECFCGERFRPRTAWGRFETSPSYPIAMIPCIHHQAPPRHLSADCFFLLSFFPSLWSSEGGLREHPATATFQRKALRPITLSDGTHIPSGTFTFSPANAISFDSNIYPDPNTFDGLRFYSMRQASVEEEKKYQLTSITKTQIQFGSGRHACPGRWFASHQIKLVLAAVLDRYDVKLKEGEVRPGSIVFQTNQFPDPKADILFRARSTKAIEERGD